MQYAILSGATVIAFEAITSRLVEKSILQEDEFDLCSLERPLRVYFVPFLLESRLDREVWNRKSEEKTSSKASLVYIYTKLRERVKVYSFLFFK